MRFRRILCFLAGIFLFLQIAAGERYRFQTFGPDDGLSPAVGRILQDRTGFLWVGTGDGLFRYDGARFQRFGVEEGLPGVSILHLAESPDGTLWVLTQRGLARWRHTEFEPVPVASEGGGTEWLAMAISGDNRLYVGTNRGLLVARIPADGSKPHFTQASGSPSDPVPGVYLEPQGGVWFGCALQLCLIEDTRLRRFGVPEGLPTDHWGAMLLDRQGNLWVRGIQHLYMKPPGVAGFQARDRGLPQSSNGTVTIIEDQDGVILVSTDLGLARWVNGAWQLIGSAQGLESDAVTSVYQDRQGSVWLSVWGAGLARWSGYQEWTNWNTSDGLSNNIVWAVQRHPSGALLVGTDRGLVRLEDGRATKIWTKADGVAGDKIKAIAIGRDGTVWTGSLPGGVSRIDAGTGRIRTFGQAEGISDTRVIGLYLDAESRLWASTAQGLFRAAAAGPSPRFERLTPPGARDGTMFYRFLGDRQGRIWVGSTDGLFCWDGGAWSRLTTHDGLRSNGVTHIAQTGDGAIWVAYREPIGMSRLDITASGIRVEHVTKKDGLPGDYVLFLGLDGRRRLWVGTGSGVAVESSGKWMVYTHDDGLVWDDCAANGFLGEPDGTVWIGTLKGLSRFQAKQEPHFPPALPAVITSVKFGDKAADSSAVLRVAYQDRDFSVSFSGLASANGKNVRFRYRLAGQGEGWTETGLRALRYPSLPAGFYRFEVSTRNGAGPWSLKPATVSFRIVPAWWQTWWFASLAAGVLISGIALAVRSRMQKTEWEHRRLENAVRERTEELELQNDVVAQQKDEIEELLRESREVSKLKSEFLANMSHEIRTPMNAVIGMSELALDTPLDEEQRDYISTVRDSATALLVLLNDILDFSKMEAGKMELSREAFNVRKCAAGAIQLFAWKAKEKGLQLTLEVASGVPDWLRGDADRLRQILVNLVGNAMKFTDSGEVALTVSEVDEAEAAGSAVRRLRFSVRDTGIGIPADKQAMIFEAFAQADGSASRQQGGTGLGLAICSGLAHLMHGTIRVKSAPGRGSEFSVTLAFEAARAPDQRAPDQSESPAAPVGNSSGGDFVEPPTPLRILLAEDNRVNQKVAQLILQKQGHTVTVVEDGRQAIEAARKEKFDLILMDIQMPVMDGAEATSLIREEERKNSESGRPAEHTPIVAMTAHAMSGYREECLQAGMDGYISKPIVLSTLMDTLDQVRRGTLTAAP